MSKALNLCGLRFGRLVAIKRVENSKSGKAKWLCRCDCGNEKIIFATNLVRGLTHSCGCLNKEIVADRFSKHHLSENTLYKTWSNMKKRCINPKSTSFNLYGGRGIRVCDEWLSDFTAFYEWAISSGYQDSLTIDRIDVNGNYCPENCRWVDRLTQANNCRTNHYLTYNGVTKTISEWARTIGVSDSVIRQRISKLGWSTEKALSTPILKSYKKRCSIYKKNDCYFVED